MKFERLPSLSFNSDYGVLGVTHGNYHGVFTAQGTLKIPIFEEGRFRGESQVAAAQQISLQRQIDSLKVTIDAQIRASRMDVESSAALVKGRASTSIWPPRRSPTRATASVPASPTTSQSSRRRPRSPPPRAASSPPSSSSTRPSSRWPATPASSNPSTTNTSADSASKSYRSCWITFVLRLGFSRVCAVYNMKTKAYMAEGRAGLAEAGSEAAAGSAFLSRDFRLYQTARLLVILGAEAQAVAVAWQIYQITHSALDLGLTGLALYAPVILFMLAAGHVADRYDRRSVILVCYAMQALCTLALVRFALHPNGRVWPIYAVLFAVGIGRAFSSPASSAFLPSLIPEHHFVNVVTWGAIVFQIANIAGPSVADSSSPFLPGSSSPGTARPLSTPSAWSRSRPSSCWWG